MTDTTEDGALAEAKARVLALHAALDAAAPGEATSAAAEHLHPDCAWQIVHPFDELADTGAALAGFWEGLRAAMAPVRRRPAIFHAGRDVFDEAGGVWVAEMGHLLGWWREPWLGLPPTNKAAMLRHASIYEVRGGRVARAVIFLDILDLLHQAGLDPLPPASGALGHAPPPRTMDGIKLGACDAAEGERTMRVVRALTESIVTTRLGTGEEPPHGEFWTDDMTWWGPGGWGAGHSLAGFRAMGPAEFGAGLEVLPLDAPAIAFAEGAYATFLGWPSLRLRSRGGFLGLPACPEPAEMRIVDLYRAEGNRLAENWVLIDMLHFLRMQGLDLLERLRRLPRN